MLCKVSLPLGFSVTNNPLLTFSSFSYADTPMFGQQGTPTAYLDGAQHQATYTTPATNSPTMVPGNQSQIISYQHASGLPGQLNPRPPITHTTRASPATVGYM